MQNWFIKQESALFKYRFEQETMEEKKNFLQDLNLNWRVLSNEEKEEIRQELEICAKPKQGVSIQDYITSETFFEASTYTYALNSFHTDTLCRLILKKCHT